MSEEEKPKVGVYVCHCGIKIKLTVDVDKTRDYAATLPNVTIARDYVYMCSEPGQALIKKDIKELGLNRIVVASCSPRMHEPTFRGVLEAEGLNVYFFEMANIREQCSWVHEDKEAATQKAMDLIKSSVARVSLLEPLETKEVDVVPEAVVIGGGITGIYTALDIANAGCKVHLVEKSPTVGGKMAMLDKTFPTLDCSACILTPRMVDVSRHPNIDLMTYCEVEEISGAVGNFTAKVKKKSRYIETAVGACTGCNLCAEACRMKKIPDEYNAGMANRSAAYLPFPYAVPAIYTIDPEKCIMVTKGKCGKATLESCREAKEKGYPEGIEIPPCVEACGPKVIDFDMKDEIVELNVGAIVVAIGYDLVDPVLKAEYGYHLYDNVITGLEFERLSSASGPTLGHIEINGKEPKDIVFIQCVGSRDKQIGNEYCSRVCCMYSCKQAILAKEKMEGVNVSICYIDTRAYGKGFEEFYERAQRMGITYMRGQPGDVYRKAGTDRLIVRGENTFLGEPYELEADLVVLATGIVPAVDADKISTMLKLAKSPDGFFAEAHAKLRPVDTALDGVFLAGCCQAPKDIPDSVAQGKGAAASALALLVPGKTITEAAISEINEDLCSGCRSCEAVCAYDALEFDEEKKVMKVNEAVCKGCGACSATCSSGAASALHYRDAMVYAQIEALTS